MKRTTFTFANIPAATTPATLATLTFTPPTSGTAVLSARGYCNMVPIAASDNEINIAIAPTASGAFLTNTSTWGVMNVPRGSVSGLYQNNWSAETTQNVTAGVATTMVLAGRHETGNTTSDCSGSFKVEIYTGTLP